MKKHIIITGPEQSGKTLFAKMIFPREKTLYINGLSFDPSDAFLYDNGAENWKYENILIDDLHPQFTCNDILQLVTADKLYINRLNRMAIEVDMPRFIFISNYLTFCSSQTIKRRFHIVDSEGSSISDWVKMIKEEEITIKTHW